MAIVTLNWEETPPAGCRSGAVAVGNFDGVHRGHVALLAELAQQAREVNGPVVVLTFDPHPLKLLRPEQFLPVLTLAADRAQLLEEAGADQVVILRTTASLLQLTAADFFEQVLRQRLGAGAVVEGANFAFGHNREGTVEDLRRMCAVVGLTMRVVTPFLIEGVMVSSSRVRSALLRGAVGEAAQLLGRPYRLRGIVGSGQRRGATLGFPTANVEHIETVIPADGVYAVRVPYGGALWAGAVNVGPNPTFGEQARKVEVHLIGFQGDLYGRPLAFDFVERLRDTRPFRGVEELVQQLRRDVEEARKVVGR
jgi:riboflavin kinase / FMN adenylyltransferase